MKSSRTKATSISQKVKQKVNERDNSCCIFCGKFLDVTYSNAHIVPRSKGGLGIEENIITACFECHHLLDQTTNRSNMLEIAIKHVSRYYLNWDINDMIYQKGKGKYFG